MAGSTWKRPSVRQSWHCRPVPTAETTKNRFALSDKAIERLREAAHSLSGDSTFLRKRRYVMLRLLEMTGGRRGEICRIRCSAVRRAAAMEDPILEIPTIKRKGGWIDHRLLPVSRTDLFFLLEFIEKNRPRIIRATCGRDQDDDILLVSETTGHGLKPNTISQELFDLVNEAGIDEKTCAHMFRHRFITKLLVALIQQHEAENPDAFRKLMFSSEAIKQKVLEATGQKSILSLDPYIDMGFAEITNFQRTCDIVRTAGVIDSFKGSLAELRSDIAKGTTPGDVLSRLDGLLEMFRADLERVESPAPIS